MQLYPKASHSLVKQGVRMGLSIMSVALLVCVNLLLFCYEILPWNIYMSLPILIIAGVALLEFMFGVGCGVYERSGKTLQKWKSILWMVQRSGQQGVLRRVLKSLRPISFPVGDIGIMDKDIQVNYWANAVNFLVNSSFLVKDMIHGLF